MPGGFVLRRLGALDLDLASTLHGSAFAPIGERMWTRQDLAELLTSPGVSGWVVKYAQGEIGFGFCIL